MERFYRSQVESPGWKAFTVQVKETDLWIRARKDCSEKGFERVFQYRNYLETYIHQYPQFKESLIPLALDPTAPAIVQSMLQAGIAAGVGPMAAVAGAMAEFVGRDLLKETEDVIIENGGDLFLSCREPVIVGIFAGESPVSGKVGIRLPVDASSRGLCTSSGTVGHSISYGRADAVTILSPSAALSDAVATATGNRVHTKNDIQSALDWAQKIPDIEGVLIIIGDQMGVWGKLELVPL
jgi:hypothetical protein